MAVTADEQAEHPAARVDLDRIVARARILRPWVRGLIAYLVYQAIAIVLWAIPILGDPAHRILGTEVGDTRSTNGRFGWTPWALQHAGSPIYSDRMFAWRPIGGRRSSRVRPRDVSDRPVFGPLVSTAS
jgi:hypothetical protein